MSAHYGKNCRLPFVILRPGMVYGPGKSELSGRVGINTFGFFIHLGGGNELPMTFVDNCAEAIVLAALKPGVDGETFNVVDDEKMTSRDFLSACKSAKSFFPSGFRIGLRILAACFGKIIQKNPVASCRRFSTAAAPPPNGRAILFPTRNSTTGSAGNKKSRSRTR